MARKKTTAAASARKKPAGKKAPAAKAPVKKPAGKGKPAPRKKAAPPDVGRRAGTPQAGAPTAGPAVAPPLTVTITDPAHGGTVAGSAFTASGRVSAAAGQVQCWL